MDTSALWTAETKADPFPVYSMMRKEAPVCRVVTPEGFEIWMITRYEDVRQALTDPRLANATEHAPEWLRSLGLVGEGDASLGRHLLTVDPPEHTRLRRLVSKAFTRGRMEALRPRVQRITDELLDAMAAGEEADLIESFAFPLPITVICELLGVPGEDQDDFRGWSRTILTAAFTPEGMAERAGAGRSMARYVAGLIARRRPEVDPAVPPGEQPDLISGLILASEDRDTLSESELKAMIRLLLIAGHETTVNLIGNGMVSLFRHPDQLRLLRERPELLPGAIEELLRYDGPVDRGMFRYTTEDVEIGGQRIPKGSAVVGLLGSADRDPARYADADVLDITREDTGHLAFGHGAHFCLGAPLARVEGQVAIGSLLARFPDISLACDPSELRWHSGGFGVVRGVEALPVRLRAGT
ncbi:cytochrome P450 family protein [Bailinhaonella thermotolerans]|uniref:cytochrome P450 family protein n=1 Tax=Bailinhaonella thermotolerans TaxID=1070861 RepID=UPI00192A5207|nr:cytochrome P450 [Bailinhaonella thermotolerans]